jgi:hypothetical protein
MDIEVSSRFCGPPRSGHGGYVAGLFAERMPGCVQVTLRRPIPLDERLQLVESEGGKLALFAGEALIADAEPAVLELEVPRPPTLEQAVAAEAGSPSHRGERGVHPICFGCGQARTPGDALRIFVGPCEVDGKPLVAGGFRPGASFAGPDGVVPRLYVLAALDCPGAFAFIAGDVRAGLLGRIVFESYREVRADADYIVTGWQVGSEGRKLFAGTALFDARGELCAAARAVWFQPAR